MCLKSMYRKFSSINKYDKRKLVRTLRYTLFLVPGTVKFMAVLKLGGAVFGLFAITPQLNNISSSVCHKTAM